MEQKPKSSKLGCFLYILIPVALTALLCCTLDMDVVPIGPLLLALSFCIYMLVQTIRGMKHSKKVRAEAIAKTGASEAEVMEHIAGLPVPDGAFCVVLLCPDRYVFDRDGNQFNLAFEKVSDVVCKTETEIQNNYVSSVGGAIAGAALFGPVGAAIGGRAKKKTDRIVHKYLIFAYEKEEQTDFITFDCTNCRKTQTFISAFKNFQSNRPSKQVEL